MPRKRFVLLLMASLLAVAFLAGCVYAVRTTAIRGNGNALRDNTLVIYSPHPVLLSKPLLVEFEKETGIHPEMVRAGTGELLARLDEEKDAPACDVMWGGSVSSVSPKSYLFDDYVSANNEQMQPDFRNDGGPLTWFSDLPRVLIINTNLVSAQSVKGYADLLNPSLRGRIAAADPAKSDAAYEHLSNMLAAMGQGNEEQGWAYVASLCQQLDGKLMDNSRAVYQSVADGDMAVGLTFEEGAAKSIADGAPVAIVYMEEGVAASPDGIYLVKGAKHPENAKKLIDFLTGSKAQSMLVTQLHRRSVRSDMPAPRDIPPKDKIHMIPTNPYAAQKREAWVAHFHQIYDHAAL
jgi:iron(III) transport system substrate-binding protein